MEQTTERADLLRRYVRSHSREKTMSTVSCPFLEPSSGRNDIHRNDKIQKTADPRAKVTSHGILLVRRLRNGRPAMGPLKTSCNETQAHSAVVLGNRPLCEHVRTHGRPCFLLERASFFPPARPRKERVEMPGGRAEKLSRGASFFRERLTREGLPVASFIGPSHRDGFI
ncbi:uncharacterized protein LOC105662725 isoform X1 [Megachile rotundata]|uniref:uncharacterized protein LOC105662725 isoform X1 n=1 Tax=Megachile rotundata TaxID=143995 RepID=UPI003FD02623